MMLRHTHKTFANRAEAEAFLETVDLDDWTAVIDQSEISERCIIKIYDEDGEFVHNI